HVRKVPLAPDVNLKTIARGTPGFSGADLMNLVNEAALTAARRNKRMVTQAEFEEAKDKVLMGAERRSMVMTEEEKMLTAYHEAGHAIVGLNVPSHDPIHKATIIPRGRALGMVQSLPEADRHSHTREWCVSKLAMMFGGREAEVQKFGPEKVTNGATGDIQQATNLARAMVMEWGMSDKLGRVRYQSNEQEVFLGHSVARSTNISDDTARLIDSEIRGLIEAGEQEGMSLEVVDLRSVSPIDMATVEESVRATTRAIVVQEAARTQGIGAELSARLTESLYYVMEAPVLRVTSPTTPYPPSRVESSHLPDVDRILDAVDRSLAY
ncbi:MAG: transketolase C-terminal domain-containing protein, partial [Dermabacter sp.]|nr:transketolase C-terminal domain-containing protein [Dermabacter sp.]